MSGDVHVRICERLGVKFPRATRPVLGFEHEAEAKSFLEELRARVIATAEKEFASLIARYGSGKVIIDLVGTGDFSNPATLSALKSYDGIAW
jgi:hypothetical protein